MSKELKPYTYFTAPDGHDVLEKFLLVLKPAALTGLGLSVVDTVCYSHPKGYLATFGRYIYVTTPVVAATGTFVIVSNIVGSIRKKDDQCNWFAGGVSAGILLGGYFKNKPLGFVAATLLGFGLMGIKAAHLNNYKWLYDGPMPNPEGATSFKYDFTLTKERPRNWTTGRDN